MPDKKITDLVDGAPLQATDEFVVARAGDNFKIDGAEVVAAVTKHDVTLAGNTAGALALISSGTMTLAGGNNITLSQAGNAVTISGGGGAETQTGISGIANSQTTYTSGTVSLSELGAITIRSTTGNQFQLSVNPQSVQPETQTFIGGISASDTLYTSGTVRLTGVGGGITVSSNTGQRIDLSVAAQSVQPETQTFVGGIGNSETTYTSGTVNLSVEAGLLTIRSTTGQAFRFSVSQSVQPETQTFLGGLGNSQTTYTSGTVNLSVVAGNLTIRSTTGQAFQFSMSQTVQPETQTAISGIANSQTTYTSGTVSLSELGAITIRSTTGNQYQLSVNAQTVQTQGILSAGVSTGGNTVGNTTVNTGSRFVLVASGNATASQATAAGASTVTISVGTQTVQTQGILSAGVSTGGNTSGDTTVNTGSRLVLAGGNNITLSQGTAAGATTITISAGAGGGATFSGGMSTGGNTSGDTGFATQRLALAGGNNITLSGSTNAGSMTITISAPNLGAGAMSAGVSNLGNTAGSTGVTGTQLVLVGTGDVTLSQSTNANGGTVTLHQTYLSLWDPNGAQSKNVSALPGQATLAFQPWTVVRAYVHDRIVSGVQYSQATNSTLSVTISGWCGLYTRNVSTLSLLSSQSGTYSINGSGTASSVNNVGLKFLTFPWTNTVPAGEYWLGAISRTTTGGANASLSNILVNLGLSNSGFSGVMGVVNNNTQQMQLGMGTYSATTTALPASVAFSQIGGLGTAAHRLPWIWFLSQSA